MRVSVLLPAFCRYLLLLSRRPEDVLCQVALLGPNRNVARRAPSVVSERPVGTKREQHLHVPTPAPHRRHV